MRILVASSGNIVQLAKYPRHFAKMGHEVVFTNPSWRNALCGRTFEDEFGGLNVRFSTWADFDHSYRMRSCGRFDVIFGTQHGAALEVLKYQDRLGIPALLRILDIADSNLPDILAAQAPLIATYSKIRHLTGINPAIPPQIEALTGRTDCDCVFYPVDTELLDSAPEAQTEDFVLIVSRHTDFKRVDLALRACAYAKKSIVLVTQDDHHQTLHNLARELGFHEAGTGTPDFQFIPLASDRVKASLLRRCKLHIFTQMWAEAPCIPSAEALYCRKPSIIFDYPAQRAIEGGYSIYVEPGDWRAMGEAILGVYKDYGSAVEQATLGSAWVAANLAPSVVAQKILTKLETIAC